MRRNVDLLAIQAEGKLHEHACARSWPVPPANRHFQYYPRPHHRNAVARCPLPRAFSLIESHLRYRDFPDGSVLWDAGAPTERCTSALRRHLGGVPVKTQRHRSPSVGREAVAGLGAGLGQSDRYSGRHPDLRNTVLYIGVAACCSARQNEEIARVAAVCSTGSWPRPSSLPLQCGSSR